MLASPSRLARSSRMVAVLSLAGAAACEGTAARVLASDMAVPSASHLYADEAPRIATPSGSFKASLGTLPEAQGWTYGGDNGNAPPVVANGVLAASSTAGVLYWRMFLPVQSFAKRFAFEARVKILSSNYVPNIGTGTREGYYFMVSDSTSSYTIGLADSGFNVNSLCSPNQPLTPYLLADGQFHDIHLRVSGGRATLSIDGAVVASNLLPDPFSRCPSIPGIVTFGAVAGVSRSTTELKDFAFRTW